MARFVPWPDPILRSPAEPVEVDDRARAVWQEMLEAMYATRGLVGLAAPQLGHGLRLAVLDCSKEKREPLRLANPELVWVSETMRTHHEGSPNLSGVSAEIERPAEVRVRFLNEAGAVVETAFEGLWATAVQHQIDHLEGRMFFDRLGPVRRQRLLEKARKARKARQAATRSGA